MDDLADLIADRSDRDGPAAGAAYCRELLDDLPSFASRAHVLVHLGDCCEMAGDAEGAEDAFREAVADGGAAFPDACSHLAAWLIRAGRAAEAEPLLAEFRAARPQDPSVYEYVAEGYEEAGDLAAATRWFTSGVLRLERVPGVTDRQLYYLLIGRWRVRKAQGLDEDEYDELALELKDEVVADLRDGLGLD